MYYDYSSGGSAVSNVYTGGLVVTVFETTLDFVRRKLWYTTNPCFYGLWNPVPASLYA